MTASLGFVSRNILRGLVALVGAPSRKLWAITLVDNSSASRYIL
jgi:hypothetical protein